MSRRLPDFSNYILYIYLKNNYPFIVISTMIKKVSLSANKMIIREKQTFMEI